MKRTLLTLAAALMAALTWGAETGEPQVSLEGVRIFGGDLGISWGGWKLVAGGGYESPDFGRDDTGDPLPKAEPANAYEKTFPNASLKLLYLWDLDGTVLWLGSGVLAHGDWTSSTPSPGAFPDLSGNSFGFAQAGVTRDHRKTNDHGVVSGTKAEAYLEWGPSVASLRSTDYWKASFKGSHLMPVWDWDGDGHVFSGTLANRLQAQWTDGQTVPMPLLVPTEVRGYYRLLDTRFQSVVTSELRVGLPSLWGPHDLVPVLFAFGEGGWYYGYANSTSALDRSGWLASVGAGLGLSVWGFTTPTVAVALPLTDGESGLWWKINFDLRF